MVQHYVGDIGAFDFDDTLWELKSYGGDTEYLHWIGGDQVCNLPKGCISCKRMFYQCILYEGFQFGDFDTSLVEDMSEMFRSALFYTDIDFGDKFDTSAVKDMNHMFYSAAFNGKFNLGKQFNTRNVKRMDAMFYASHFNDSLDAGELFCATSNVNMNDMFRDCFIKRDVKFPKSFQLGIEHKDIFNNCRVGFIDLSEESPLAVIASWTGLNNLIIQDVTSPKPFYDFTKVKDIPTATLKYCTTKEEFDELLEKYCKV